MFWCPTCGANTPRYCSCDEPQVRKGHVYKASNGQVWEDGYMWVDCRRQYRTTTEADAIATKIASALNIQETRKSLKPEPTLQDRAAKVARETNR